MKQIYTIVCIITLLISFNAVGQEVDLENIKSRTLNNIKKNPFKINGGISSNFVFYNSNTLSSRDAFTYFLNANINLKFYQWSMPVSLNLTNQGSNIDYQIPWKFNRISVHPKYKWVQAHIGDINMSFSPYTYNGLTVTGAGVELTPKIPLKVALIAGRLNKAIESDENPQTIPAFKRDGYGINLKWEKEKYKIGVIGFYAKDERNSLKESTVIKNTMNAKENLVISINASSFVHKNIELYGSYANSVFVSNLQAKDLPNQTKSIGALFLSNNSSTESFNSYNTGINFNLKKLFIGIKYERVDPEYKTLGAYYFNNDLENITVNTNFSILKDKLTITANIGRQIDNLKQQKLKKTSRWVGAINANLKLSDKLIITTNYSNFTMYTNKQQNQFNNINKNPLQLQQPKDSIDFKQISQNTNINISYIISSKKECTQNLNINYSLSDVVNKENKIVRKGGISRFHNAFATYGLSFPNRNINILLSANYTHSYTSSFKTSIWGPSIAINKTMFKNKLRSSLGLSYNKSSSSNSTVNNTSLRISGNYTPWKRHNINLSLVQMFRDIKNENNQSRNETTIMLGYSYSF